MNDSSAPKPNFSPSLKRTSDRVAGMLQAVAYSLVILAVGTLPLSMFYSQFINLGFTKTVLVLTASLVALVCFCLAILRTGALRLNHSPVVYTLWLVAGVTVLSALISTDRSDSFFGEVLEVHTAAFVLIMAVVATLGTTFSQSASMTLRFYQLLMASTIVLGLFHLLRIIFGVDFLSFGLFQSQLASPLGAWNDLAIFFGLIIVLCLISLEQMPLSRPGQVICGGLITIGLAMLAVINFFYVWIVVGGCSLIFLIYSLTKDRFSASQATDNDDSEKRSLLPLALNGLVFFVSTVFVLGGSLLGAWISDATDISYLEVRPSFTATVDVGRSVYGDNAFTGIGPNRFSDAWRMYKDPSINDTVFWNTNFVAGSGYIPTFFVTTGLFGAVAWLIFLGTFLYTGYRLLTQAPSGDRFWYFVGTGSFVSALFIWGMCAVYVPGAALLLLAAFLTGLTVAARAVLLPNGPQRALLVSDRRAGFILIACVMIIMLSSIAVLYKVGRQYAAVYVFSRTVNDPAITIESIRQGVDEAFALHESDTFARQLGRIESERVAALAQVPEPTDEQISQYQTSLVNGLNALRRATALDPTQPLNWGYLGQLYLVVAGTNPDLREQATELAAEAIAQAKQLDPQNPEYRLIEAQFAIQSGDSARARELAAEAVGLKRDFTSALTFLAQLDIAEGNTEAAISTVRSIIQLEPNNPARYYQLGVLLSSVGDTAGVIAAMEAAIARDQEYANARYVLALAYLEAGREAEAVEQLTVVRDLNPENAGVETLIQQIETGTLPVTAVPDTETVSEPPQVSVDDDVTTTTVAPDTDLVTPINIVPASSDVSTAAESSDVPVDTQVGETASPPTTDVTDTGETESESVE